jgi:hypothetical protein
MRLVATSLARPIHAVNARCANQVRLAASQPKAPAQANNPALMSSSSIEDSINWRKVDLSQITIPQPKFPEPQLHYEDGRTFFKHPLRFHSLVPRSR